MLLSSVHDTLQNWYALSKVLLWRCEIGLNTIFVSSIVIYKCKYAKLTSFSVPNYFWFKEAAKAVRPTQNDNVPMWCHTVTTYSRNIGDYFQGEVTRKLLFSLKSPNLLATLNQLSTHTTANIMLFPKKGNISLANSNILWGCRLHPYS